MEEENEKKDSFNAKTQAIIDTLTSNEGPIRTVLRRCARNETAKYEVYTNVRITNTHPSSPYLRTVTFIIGEDEECYFSLHYNKQNVLQINFYCFQNQKEIRQIINDNIFKANPTSLKANLGAFENNKHESLEQYASIKIKKYFIAKCLPDYEWETDTCLRMTIKKTWPSKNQQFVIDTDIKQDILAWMLYENKNELIRINFTDEIVPKMEEIIANNSRWKF